MREQPFSGSAPVASARVYDQSGRLFDHDSKLVLVHDRQLHRLRLERDRLGRLPHVDFDLITRATGRWHAPRRVDPRTPWLIQT